MRARRSRRRLLRCYRPPASPSRPATPSWRAWTASSRFRSTARPRWKRASGSRPLRSRCSVTRPGLEFTLARRFVLAVGALALGLYPAPALGSPLLELTGDPYGHGGLTGRASTRGAAAAYFNPALLVEASDGLTLGVLVLS